MTEIMSSVLIYTMAEITILKQQGQGNLYGLCVYKECLYSMLDAVQQSEIYPYLRDRDVDADEAEKELRNKIDELLEQNAKTAPLYLEASQNWENFKDWLVEDIFQHTYQDVITDRRDAVALY